MFCKTGNLTHFTLPDYIDFSTIIIVKLVVLTEATYLIK